MENLRHYELEGLILNIPLRDDPSGVVIEDYREYIEKIRFTPAGHPVMFAGEDACEFAREATPGGCPDCGSCLHYHRPSDHTWIGICTHEENRQLGA